MRTARSVAVVALCCAFSCATARTTPIVISAHVLDAAGMTFESVATGMQHASERNALTAEQVAAWNDFTVRWAAGYGAAVTRWVDAKQRLDSPAAEQAAALLTGLLSELGTFQVVVMGAQRAPQSYEMRGLPEILFCDAIWPSGRCYRADGSVYP